MEVKDRIKAILDCYNLSVNEFVTKTGVKTGQAVYDLMSGKTKSISASMEDKILSCFQDLNKIWLLTGEGEMLKVVEEDKGSGTTTSIEKLYTELTKIRAEMGEMETKYQTQLEQKDKTISLLLQEISKLHDHIIGASTGKKMASR